MKPIAQWLFRECQYSARLLVVANILTPKKCKTSVGYLVTAMLLLPALTFAAPQLVGVVNGENRPIPVYDVVQKEPYQWGETDVGFSRGTSATTSFVVPDGKRFIIEHVSGSILIETEGELVEFMVATTANGMYANHGLSLTRLGNAGGLRKSFTVSQNIALYADSNTEVVFSAHRSLPGTGVMHVSVSGYLLDLN